MTATQIINMLLLFFCFTINFLTPYFILKHNKSSLPMFFFFIIIDSVNHAIIMHTDWLNTIFSDFTLRQNILTIVHFGLLLFYIMFHFSSPRKEKIQVFSVLIISVLLGEVSTSITAFILLNTSISTVMDVLMPLRNFGLFCNIFLYLLILLCMLYHFKRTKPRVLWNCFFPCVCLWVICIYIIFPRLPLDKSSSNYLRLIYLFSYISGGLFLLLFYQILLYLRKKEISTEKLRFAYEMQRNDIEHSRVLKDKAEEMRRIQHDFKDQLLCLKLLIEQNTDESLQRANALIETFDKRISDSKVPVYTNNIVVNTMLFAKIAEAEQKGVRVIAEVNIPEELSGIDEFDLNLLLINLLNNAVEACLSLPQNVDKTVQFKMGLKGNFLFFKAENPYTNLKTNPAGELLTTKKDRKNHGIGMTIIKTTAKKYHGTSVYSTENGIFTHTVSLELPKA